MDRNLPPEVILRARVKRCGVLAATVIIVGGGVLFLRAAISPTLDRSRILTAVAEIGPVEETVTASGVVVPEHEQILTAPVASTIARVPVHSGDSVRAGVSILELDTEALQLRCQQITDELEIQKNKKRQLELKLEREKADLQALRADVYLVTSFKDSVVRVKNGPFHKSVTNQKVFVIHGDRAIAHTVDIGVSNFADVVRIPAPDREPCDIHEILRSLQRLMSAECERRNIAWVADLARVSLVADADAQQMEQVLVNVFKNAIEAIGQDGTITVITATEPSRQLRIADTGPGIAQAESPFVHPLLQHQEERAGNRADVGA